MARVARILGWSMIVLLVLVGIGAGLAFLLIRSQPGHDFLLRTALRQLPSFVNGEVKVTGIRSDGILQGFHLHGISIHDPAGRPFLEMDSLQVRYSVRDLLARDLVVVPVRAWAPRVTVETLAPDSVSNVQRIFGGSGEREPGAEASEETVDTGFRLALRGVEIHEGSFTLRFPLEGDGIPGGVIEEAGAGGSPHQVLSFHEIESRIAEAELLGAELEGERIRFDRLSFRGEVLAEPFRIADFRGVFERSGDRMTLDAERLWFPETESAGRVVLELGGDEGLALEAVLEIPVLQLSDFRWLDPTLPDGSASLDLSLSLRGGAGVVQAGDAELRVGRSRVTGRGGLEFGEGIRLAGAELALLPLELSALDPWLDEPLPVQGSVTGRLSLEGPLGALRTRGEVTLAGDPSGPPALPVRFEGLVAVGEDPGVGDLELILDPLDYQALGHLLPDLPVRGTGRLAVRASGSAGAGFDLQAEIEHRLGAGEPSRITLGGRVEGRTAEELELALEVVLDPLLLEGMAEATGRTSPVPGEVSGVVEVVGPLRELAFSAGLETPAGRLDAAGVLDPRDPGAGYRAEGSVERFRVHALLPSIPDSTVLTGAFQLRGSGLEPAVLAGEARLDMHDSWGAGIPLDTLALQLLAEDGRLRVEELELRSPVLVLSGEGELPLREEGEAGEIRVAWDAASLAVLRPILFGDAPIAADTLTSLERQILRAEGVDPDTLGVAAQIELDGRMRGDARLRGTLGDLAAEGFVGVDELAWGGMSLEHAEGTVRARWLEGDFRRLEGAAAFSGLVLDGFVFEGGEALLEYEEGEGSFGVELRGGEGERYAADGTFFRDEAGVDVRVATMILDLEEVRWALAHPALVRVRGSVVEVEGLAVERPGAAPEQVVRIEADGYVDREGDSDLRLRAVGVDLDRVARIAQTGVLPSGVLDLEVALRGPAGAPLLDGSFAVHDFAAGGTALTRVEGTLAYAARRLRVGVTGEIEGEPLLVVEGVIPVDLSLQEVDARFPAEEIDLVLAVRSLPAGTLLAFLEGIEDVAGTLDGELRLSGRTDAVEPSGELALRGGSLLLPEIGIRLVGIDADVRVREDGTLEVDGVVQSRGSARISGTLDLSELTDPGFALTVVASGFQAVDRRDLSARVGADIVLAGRYSAPQVEGVVRVEQGELFLEEFARTAEVIDLTDPSFFDVVDTSFVAVRPAVEAAQNPFLQNLRVDVDLSLQRDFWLRSREINAEIAGSLGVVFERSTREILLVGTLEPVRGTYATFGRQFQVEGGTVEFAGTPGINPTLNIDAVTRLRREGGEPLTISAHVGGTLTSPRVTLGTDAQPPIAESDLISYLLFGRPSYALASAETTALQGALGAGVSRMTGTIAAQLGTVVGRQIGFDYFSITQAEDPTLGLGSAAGLSGSFAHTQIEVGQYLAPNLFLAVVLRPLGGLQGGGHAQIPGARLEWRFSDAWSMEGFVEDRFAREGVSGFGELGLRLSRIFGLFLYREWGY